MAVLFFVLVANRQYVLAAAALTVCALTREDFALHIFGFLFVWLGYEVGINRKPLGTLKPWLAFMIASGVAGVSIVVLQKLTTHGDEAITRVFLGHPILSHVNLAFIGERVSRLLTTRTDLLVLASSSLLLCVI